MRRSEALSPDEIAAALRELPGWTHEGERLRKEFTFADFTAAMRFMQACVPPIEQLDHHPTWTNTYAKVQVELTTHDAGNRVTAADVALAAAIEGVAS